MDGLADVAEQERAEIIVMGAHGSAVPVPTLRG